MADRFIVHLDGQRAAWLDTDGALVRADSAAAGAAAGAREVDVLIPGEQVLITRVTLPPIRQARRRLQAAAFALEDQLVARVDTLHFALAPRAGADGQTAVVVIDDTHMRTIMDLCADAAIDALRIVPDVLALPAPAAGDWQVCVIGDRILTRTAGDAGFAGERELWGALAGPEPPARVVIAAAQPASAQALLDDAGFEPAPAIDSVACDDDETVFARLLAHADTSAAINLRQGRYARASAMQTWWQPFRITAGLAAAWLLIAIAARGIESWQLHQRIDALHARSVAAFRDAFPDVRSINDLRVQAEQNIRSLRGAGNSDGGVFSLLQATADVTDRAGGIQVRSMQYRDGALYLSLRGENVQALEALRAGFARQQRASLDVESADAADNGVRIRASVSQASNANNGSGP